MREFFLVYKDIFSRDGYPDPLSTSHPSSYYVSYLSTGVPLVILSDYHPRFTVCPLLYLSFHKDGNFYRASLQRRRFNFWTFDDETVFDDLTGFYWEDGPPTVSYSSVLWSDLEVFPTEFFVVCEDSQGNFWVFRSNSYVSIHELDIQFSLVEGEEFSNNSFAPGQWIIVLSTGKDYLSRMVPYNEKDSVLLNEICKVANSVFGHFDFMSEYLHSSRSFSSISNFDITSLRLMLGLSLDTDALSHDRERILCCELPSFWEASGSKRFLKLMELVTGIEFSCEPLWTKDYISFVPKEEIPANEADLYYPTSHVYLSYSIEASPLSFLSKDDVNDLFYSLAPIELVLFEVVGIGTSTETYETTLYFSANHAIQFYQKADIVFVPSTIYLSPGLSGYVHATTQYRYSGNNPSSAYVFSSNFEVLIKTYFETLSSVFSVFWFSESSPSNSGYFLTMSPYGTHTIHAFGNQIGGFNNNIPLGDLFFLRLRSVNGVHQIKLWMDGSQEPNSWSFEFTDNNFRRGCVGISTRDMMWVEVHHVTTRV